MKTKFLTSINLTFSPFALPSGRTARHFLALLPPNARSTMKISVKMLGRESAVAQKEKGSLQITFKDGRALDLDLERVGIKEVQGEVDRHSRVLARLEELSGA